MKRIITLVMLACISALPALAQTRKDKAGERVNTERVILRLENEGREATLKNDIEANDRLLADNWVNVNPDGSVTTKAKLMELLKDSSFRIMSIENDEVLVRTYGDAAVVTGRSTTKRAGQGSEVITRQVRFTRVYARSKGRWQVVSAHNTLISSPSTSGAGLDPAPRQVRAAISTAWRDHIDAAKRKDVKGVVAMYSEDVVYIIPGASEVRGRPAINTMEAQGLAAADVLEAAHTSHDVQVFNNVAYEIGTIAGPVRAKGQTVKLVTFHFMGMWQLQEDGAWRLSYLVGRP
jgi:ketosteroid isomerase-like protein